METIYQIQNLTQNAIISQVTAKACDNKIHMGECRFFVVVKKTHCMYSFSSWNYGHWSAQFHIEQWQETTAVWLHSSIWRDQSASISSRWHHFHFHIIQVTTLSLSFYPGCNSFFFIWSSWHHWKILPELLALHLIGADNLTWYNFQNYLPSILIVAVSWVSFWMDIESVPGRCFPNHPKQTTGKSAID